ncbi:MAG TPA: tetratricopeptide repeat protein, partial [Candidatus Deferrimicrobiaceae bacterium]
SDGIAPVRRIFPQLRLREVVLEKIPMLALSAMASALTIAAQRAGGAVSDLGDIPISLRLSNIAVSYTRYLAKAVWPAHLAALYPMPKSIPAWEVAGGAIFLLAMTVAVVRFGHRRPWLCIGWLWFLGAMVPMIGIVQVGRQAMADRYAYLPFIGLYIAFSFSVADLVARQPGRHARILIGIAIVALVGGLGLAARAQAAHWKDSRALFERLVESDPGEGWYNLGNLDLLEGKPLAAERSYREAIRADPRHGRARTALAVEMIRSGHVAEAIPLLEEAIRLEPDYVKSWYNLGAAYGRLGDDDAALRVYEQVLEWRPDDTIAMVAAGSLRIRKGDVDSGLAILQRAANLAPEDRELLDTLRDEAILAGREDIARNAGNRLQGIGPPPRR